MLLDNICSGLRVVRAHRAAGRKCRKRIEDWAPRWLRGSSLENSTLPQVIFFLKVSLKFTM